MTPQEFNYHVNHSVVVGMPQSGPSAIVYAMEFRNDWLFVGFDRNNMDADPRPGFVAAYEAATGIRPEGWAAQHFQPIRVDYEMFDLTRDVSKSLLPAHIVIPHYH